MSVAELTYAPRVGPAAGAMACDFFDEREYDCPDDPVWWWRAMASLGTPPVLPFVLVCDRHQVGLREFPSEEFVPGRLVAPGHWRARG